MAKASKLIDSDDWPLQTYSLLLGYHHFALNDPVAAITTYEAVDWSAGMDTTGQEMGLSLTCQRVDWVRGMVIFGRLYS
jgi:hypothetical protein